MSGSEKAEAKPTEAAAYIEQTAAGLGDLAKRSGLDFLAYLLEMVRLEAASRALEPSRGERHAGVAPR